MNVRLRYFLCLFTQFTFYSSIDFYCFSFFFFQFYLHTISTNLVEESSTYNIYGLKICNYYDIYIFLGSFHSFWIFVYKKKREGSK